MGKTTRTPQTFACAVIPVYNNEKTIAAVIRAAARHVDCVIVVDDGSTDGTPDAIRRTRADVVTLARNRGKGAALLTGFAAAAPTCDWALTIDGDGQHRPADGRALLDAPGHGQRVLVVGKRQGMTQEHVPWTSRFGRLFSNFWVWVSGGPWIADSQSGFRLYPLPEAMELGVRARQYQFEVEILVRARQSGIRTIEVPVSVVYQPRGVRVSHFRPWRDFLRNGATFSRLIFFRLFRLARRG